MNPRSEAAGFRCPVCGCDRALVDDINLPHLDLTCIECGWEYSVEMSPS